MTVPREVWGTIGEVWRVPGSGAEFWIYIYSEEHRTLMARNVDMGRQRVVRLYDEFPVKVEYMRQHWQLVAVPLWGDWKRIRGQAGVS